MIYKDKSVDNLQICYIGGGSRGWAWSFFKDLALESAMSGAIRLYDIDVPAAEQNRIIGEKIMAHPEAKSNWTFSVTETLPEALIGADIVVISILPGTFEEMRSDVHTPEKYGIYQTVGDTVGLGGFVRAMRTLPIYVTFAEAIRDYAPNAWVINYTNPMTLCVRTLYEVFPQIRAFGCCHEVFGTQNLLCSMLEHEHGIIGVQREELRTTVMGINHFTWLSEASYDGLDLFPLYAEFAEKYHDVGYGDGKGLDWANDPHRCAHRVKFDLFRRFGLIAAAGDRHLAEFVPRWYLRDPETVNSWGFALTTVDWRLQKQQRRIDQGIALASGAEEVVLEHSGEEGTRLIKALLGLGDIVSNVNLPNRGQIPNLPIDTVVETNALFTKNRVEPICVGPIPSDVHAIIAQHVFDQENTLRAALDCNRKLAYTTFMNDPQFTGTPAEGKELLDTMLENTRTYLPSKWFD